MNSWSQSKSPRGRARDPLLWRLGHWGRLQQVIYNSNRICSLKWTINLYSTFTEFLAQRIDHNQVLEKPYKSVTLVYFSFIHVVAMVVAMASLKKCCVTVCESVANYLTLIWKIKFNYKSWEEAVQGRRHWPLSPELLRGSDITKGFIGLIIQDMETNGLP